MPDTPPMKKAISKKKSAAAKDKIKKPTAPKKAQPKKMDNFKGTETLPLNTTPRDIPKAFDRPSFVNSDGQQPNPEPVATPMPKAAPVCVDARVKQMEKQLDELDKRQSWQEKIHNTVLEDGNITHYYNIVPSLIIAGITGALVGLATAIIYSRFKSKIA